MTGYLKNRIFCFVGITGFFVMFLLFFSGCVSSREIIEKLSDTEYTSSMYRAALEKWTKKDTIQKGLKTELIMAATYKACEFRRAYAKERDRIFRLTTDQGKRVMNDQVNASGQYDDFFVSIYTPDKAWNDFSSKDTGWNVYLLHDNEVRIEPFEIRRLKKDKKLFKSYFPFISPWSVDYIFRFKKNDRFPLSRSVTLIITGMPGIARLKWDM